jgi:aryl-alcohol dehydrogenase-like predicted oxidoreductase
VILRGEVLEVLAELRKEGCLRFLGASVYGEEAALAAIESDHYDCVQIAYSLLDRRPELRVMPAAEASDVGIVVRSVLLKGALTPRYRLLPGNLADLKRAAHQMEELAGNRLPELAYRYVLAHPATDTALVGTGRVEELEAAVRFARLGPLPDEILSQIRLIDVEDVSQLNPGNWGIA